MKKAILMSVTAACLVALSLVYLPATSASGSGKSEVTFNKDVASILYNNCAGCHRPNDIAPMSLLSSDAARPWARAIKVKVLSRDMPPWSADPRFGQFRNEHRLLDSQIATLVAWADAGAPEGEGAPPPVPYRLSGVLRSDGGRWRFALFNGAQPVID